MASTIIGLFFSQSLNVGGQGMGSVTKWGWGQ